MNKEKLGKFVAALRKEQGMTQKDLAEKLCLTDKAISKWERGLSYPDISLLEELAQVLDVSVLELLEGERKEKDSPITMEEAVKVVDHSLSISDQEITRKHKRNKSIVLGICVVTLLILSIALNVMNYAKSSRKNTNYLSKNSSAYEQTKDSNGEPVFANPDQAMQQLIKDFKACGDEDMVNYLEMIRRSVVRRSEK